MTKILLAFSGGLDSTYMLLNALRTTNHDIGVITFTFEDTIAHDHEVASYWYNFTIQARAAMSSSIPKILDFLQKNNRSIIDHHIVNVKDIRSRETSWSYYIRNAASTINDHNYDEFHIGQTREHFHHKNPYYLETSEKLMHEKTGKKIIYPLLQLNKARPEEIYELPNVLLDMIQSCGATNYHPDSESYSQCGGCSKCVKTKKCRSMKDDGIPVEVAIKYFDDYQGLRQDHKSKIYKEKGLWQGKFYFD